MLPLQKLVGYLHVADLEVEPERFTLASDVSDRGGDLLNNVLNSRYICKADRSDGWKWEWLDFVFEKVVHFCLVQFVEPSNSFLTGLIKGNFPVHLIQKVITDDHKDWTYAKFHSLHTLCISKALIKRISSLVWFVYWAKNSEILNLYCLLLLLHHVSNAFCNATPDHLEEAKGLALAHF